MSLLPLDRRDLLKWATGLGMSFALPALDVRAASRRGNDGAFAALLKDLRERDLLASTVVLCLGEFGRTPKINGADGRDHWPHGFSCLLGGGDLRSGVLIGATDSSGKEEDPGDPIPVPDLYATVLKGLGIDPTHQINTSIGRPIRYSDGTPIERLLV